MRAHSCSNSVHFVVQILKDSTVVLCRIHIRHLSHKPFAGFRYRFHQLEAMVIFKLLRVFGTSYSLSCAPSLS
jgi:hypothetical protein